jgi:hypothetical protein
MILDGPWHINQFEDELSVIRKDNTHGHNSWGWPDANGKIIIADLSEYTEIPEMVTLYHEFAERVCNVMNLNPNRKM